MNFDAIGRLVEEMVGPLPVGSHIEVRVAVLPSDEDPENPSWANAPPATVGLVKFRARAGRSATMAEMQAEEEGDVFWAAPTTSPKGESR